ncbi:MAG: NADH-quinone oxidoreductase subunit L [Candidatus Ratteibacteria bacterium]
MIFIIIILTFLFAFLIKVFKKKYSLYVAILITFLDFIFILSLPGCLKTNFEFLGISFLYDDLSFLFATTSTFVALLIFIYSLGYFKNEKEKSFFSFWALFFLGSMLGVIFSDNLLSLYFFWEIAGLCSYRLIGTYKVSEHLLKADKAFMVTGGGAGIMFLSFAFIYSLTGTFYLSKMVGFSVPWFVFLLFFIGVITKSATFPLHIWLPEASVAPTPVTAFLHAAVLVKIGIYGLLRLFWKTLSVEGNIIWAIYLALISSLIAGFVALIEKDFKKILAYSTVSQLGFLITGVLLLNERAIRGILVFYLAHALGKCGLFLTAGVMEKVFETKDITKMGSIMKKMPQITVGYFLSMLSVIGIPPFLGFFGKLDVIAGSFENKLFLVGFLLCISSILTLLYLWRTFKFVFIRENININMELENIEIMNLVVVLLGIFSLLAGIIFLFLEGGAFGY